MESLGTHKSHIVGYIWLNRSKGHFQGRKGQMLALGGHLLQNCSVTLSLFGHRAAQEGFY